MKKYMAILIAGLVLMVFLMPQATRAATITFETITLPGPFPENVMLTHFYKTFTDIDGGTFGYINATDLRFTDFHITYENTVFLHGDGGGFFGTVNEWEGGGFKHLDFDIGGGNGIAPDQVFKISYDEGFTNGDWDGIVFTLQATAIPEPTTMLLLGSGLIGLAGFRRKFRKR